MKAVWSGWDSMAIERSESMRQTRRKQLSAGKYNFEWIDNWAQLPSPSTASRGWAHHGMAFSNEGQIITFHPAESLIVVLTPDGKLVRSFEIPVTEAHGLTLDTRDGTQSMWIADNGRKRHPNHKYEYVPGRPVGKVVRISMTGEVEMELLAPAISAYHFGSYSPTSVIAFDDRYRGNGDIWVADGYGKSLVHRYNSAGEYLRTIDGSQGAGAFDCPHSLWIRKRHRDPELLIADRGNSRIQVFDMEGKYKRTIGEEYLGLPTVFADYGPHLLVGELNARVAIIDINGVLVGHLGDNASVAEEPGWPNEPDVDDVPRRTSRLVEGLFNSPHGITSDPEGNIYLTEWLIGGRYTKLAKIG